MATGERESTLEEAFKEACATVWEQRLSTQYDAVRMQLYGLYKVAKEGKCQEPKPKPDTVLGGEKNRSKWMAWMKASTFSKEEAMARYVSVALSVVKSRGDAAEGFSTGGVARVSGGGDGGVSVGASGASGGGGGGGAAAGGADGRKTSAVWGREAADAQEMARLREHTESLERYVVMIRDELTDLNDVDVSMSGWLFKWRDRDAYLWGSVKWVPRFFTLSDGKLSTYKSDQCAEAESVMSLKRCVLRDEGTRIGKAPGRGKPRPEYHVFGLYLEGAMQRGPDAGVLLRLSTDKEDVAEKWISSLGEVCAQEEDHSSPASSPCASEADQSEATPSSSACSSPVVTASMPPAPPPADGLDSAPRMSRISSVGMSRKGSWDVAGGLQNLKRLTQEVSIGRLDGDDPLDRSVRVSDQGVARDEQDKRKTMVKAKKKKKKFEPTGYPASRPMHKEAKMSILSAGASSTQNYRGLLNLMAIFFLVTNSRLIFANLRRYGVLATVPKLNEPSDLLDAPRIAGTLSLVSSQHHHPSIVPVAA
ncbi:acyl-CoA binding domain protein and partial Diacylglycerol O-acyltransferase [Ectocarpus siliculosus]|uniref:Acyl-CoA binding domain protein and partial Diacylglycerol O-acyltransferase n=1 Tax=Ectocarpus siliculosus TaxID=2880 RepID=D8LSK1_ECTSI|nr:acyl-CoA binding domain protein and partial Diacylglycerol O-acyltransferase [Ectocarpus siliculosus]